MFGNTYSSKLLDNAVNEFAKLPGVGNKTALRLVLHLLKQEENDVLRFGNSIIELKKNVKHCIVCHNISDTEKCTICGNSSRNQSIVCVVESIKDVIAIEKTQQFSGVYHVLGGKISPMDGIGPANLTIESLDYRIQQGLVEEIILALSTTMEGDTTNFYLFKKFAKYQIRITTLARGVAIGDEIEYADEVTLGRSIINRTDFVG
jgi:recombination protein RecR